MKPADAVREAERALVAAGVPEPRTDAEFLVARALGTARSQLYAWDGELDDRGLARLRSLVGRRRRREPLQYILGEWGFRRLTLALDERVLVPRPETEVVVERCLIRLRDVPNPRVLDVGVGSGAIALALADEQPRARVIGVDSSEGALAVARENAMRTGLADRVDLVHGELLAGLRGPFDLVVSNPPYVHPAEIDELEPEVRDWEPRFALVAPGTTDRIVAEARTVLAPGGWLVLECGADQAGALSARLRSVGYEEVVVSRDLAGSDRVVEGRAP